MRAVDEWIIVKYEEAPTRSTGGIYLPIKEDKSTTFAMVLDIGPNVKEPDFKVGDRVLVFAKPGVEYGEVRFTKAGNILALDTDFNKGCETKCEDCEKKHG